jgi:hypothetical protein
MAKIYAFYKFEKKIAKIYKSSASQKILTEEQEKKGFFIFQLKLNFLNKKWLP